MSKAMPNVKGSSAMAGRPKPKFNPGALKRVLKMLYKSYPVLLPITLICIIFSALVNTLPAIFNQQIIALIESSTSGSEIEMVSLNKPLTSSEDDTTALEEIEILSAEELTSRLVKTGAYKSKDNVLTSVTKKDDESAILTAEQDFTLNFKTKMKTSSSNVIQILIRNSKFEEHSVGYKLLIYKDGVSLQQQNSNNFESTEISNVDYDFTNTVDVVIEAEGNNLFVKLDGNKKIEINDAVDTSAYGGKLSFYGVKYLRQDWSIAKLDIIPKIITLAILYAISLLSFFAHTQLMAYITQGFLSKVRKDMFSGMQNLPIKYFDTHKHGDIMSHYTNDIDTLRQLVSQAIPSILQAGLIVITVFFIMLWYSVWMTFIVIAGVLMLMFVTKKVGGGSAKYFIRQQKSVGKTEGFIQEMMNGQKVIKVFCHEGKSQEDFDEINEALCDDSRKAHSYANLLGPINMNIGNILYVIIATVGGIFLLSDGFKNISLSQAFGREVVFGISVVIPFLNMTKQFTGNVNQVSQQINAIVMGLAGADRILTLMDTPPEVDDGYVTLVNAKIDENGEIAETSERTGIWAWKHPHGDGTVTYTKLAGDVRLHDVDFGYVEDKIVLHNIDLYAEPGQKVAFVGATGAGKTTITNLINRFYDIADGKIRYDGININKIKKDDLRRSLGIVLQETNLFTGTVMENIRYGRLDATDEECIEAARLAGADDFITRLPEGYATELSNNGANLSQGQRQLIAIARAAVADPPVMILDEATSSIDTRTEAIVSKGMDRLMQGRTVFVIAHRLSTVKNSDVIMVLEQGRIIERGSHDDLIAQKGKYYQLYTGAFELE